jgi:hypothetical protein
MNRNLHLLIHARKKMFEIRASFNLLRIEDQPKLIPSFHTDKYFYSFIGNLLTIIFLHDTFYSPL